MCGPRSLCGECQPCLNRSVATHERGANWSDENEQKDLRFVSRGSHTTAKFDCDCGHTFPAPIGNVMREKKPSWCPYCSNPPKKLCDDDCDQCFENSFKSHPKSQYLITKIIDEEGNVTTIDPRQIFKNAAASYNFLCPDCNHPFPQIIDKVTTTKVDKNGKPQCRWCPYCSHQLLCENEDCAICLENSFAKHPKSLYLIVKDGKTARQIAFQSNLIFEFKCPDPNCNHIFPARIYDITYHDQWCPFCCYPPQELCKDGNCIPCFNNSFAPNVRVKNWDPTNLKTPREVFNCSNDKYKFICDKGHKFEMALHNMSAGQWCPHCHFKTEAKLYEWLNSIYQEITRQAKFSWCKNENDNFLPFDWCIEFFKLIIELDGLQHFRQVSNWKSPEETTKTDIFKMQKANENGYTVIRIGQEDVLYDRINWQDQLRDAIKAYAEPTRIFISNDDKYVNHKSAICEDVLNKVIDDLDGISRCCNNQRDTCGKYASVKAGEDDIFADFKDDTDLDDLNENSDFEEYDEKTIMSKTIMSKTDRILTAIASFLASHTDILKEDVTAETILSVLMRD